MTDVPHRIRRFASAIAVDLVEDRDGVTLALRAPPSESILSDDDDPRTAIHRAMRATPSGELVTFSRGMRPIDWRCLGAFALPDSGCAVLALLREAASWAEERGVERPESLAEVRRSLPSVAADARRRLTDGYAAFTRLAPRASVEAYEAHDGADLVYGEVLDRVRLATGDVRGRACAFLRRNRLLGPSVLLADDGWAALTDGADDLATFRAAKAWAAAHHRTVTFPSEAGYPKSRAADLRRLSRFPEAVHARAAGLSPIADGPAHGLPLTWLASTVRSMPPEWVPDQPSVGAMADVVRAVWMFAPHVPFPDGERRGFSGGHDWVAFREKVAAASGPEADLVFGVRKGAGPHEMTLRFAREVMLPVAALHPGTAPTLLAHAVATITDRHGLGLVPVQHVLFRGMDVAARCATWARYRAARGRMTTAVRRCPSHAPWTPDSRDLGTPLEWSDGNVSVVVTTVGRARDAIRLDRFDRTPNVVVDDAVRVRRLLIPRDSDVGTYRCVLHVPADTYEGVIEVEAMVSMRADAPFDPVRTMTEILGCGTEDVGSALLRISGLDDVLRWPPPAARDPEGTRHAQYEVTPEAVRAVLAAWLPVLPRRLRSTDPAVVAAALEAEIGAAISLSQATWDDRFRRSGGRTKARAA